MRAVLVRRSPEVTVLSGTRGVGAGTADASFDASCSRPRRGTGSPSPTPTHEFARVLRDEGALHVWWNGFSRDVPWMRELTALRERPDDTGRRPRGWTRGA